MPGDSDRAVTTLLAGWLLAHELADDWIRDAIERGGRPEADPLAALAATVDAEKKKLKQAVTAQVGAVEAPPEIAQLAESIEALGRRLTSLEARLDGLAERLAGGA